MSATVQTIIPGKFCQVELREARYVQDLRQVAGDLLKCNPESVAFINRNKLCQDLDDVKEGEVYMAQIIIGNRKSFEIMMTKLLRMNLRQ